jgi:hypothetical protein
MTKQKFNITDHNSVQSSYGRYRLHTHTVTEVFVIVLVISSGECMMVPSNRQPSTSCTKQHNYIYNLLDAK